MSETYRSLDPQSIRYPTLAIATTTRRQFRDCLVPRDDARSRTVWYSGDAPQRVRQTIEYRAFQAHQETATKTGQLALTRAERQQIDFTTTNVFHARAVKAIAREYAVDDWLAYYDTTLSTGEHQAVYQRASGHGMTFRDAARWCA
jgi:hypothetical protein